MHISFVNHICEMKIGKHEMLFVSEKYEEQIFHSTLCSLRFDAKV